MGNSGTTANISSATPGRVTADGREPTITRVHMSLVLGAAILLTALPVEAYGQTAPGTPVVSAGTLGFQVQPEIRLWDSRFGFRQDGEATVEEVEPLGFDFTNTDFSALVPDLEASQQALRDLTGDPTFGIALGGSRVRLNALRIEIPITASLGITDWLTVTGTVPFVRRRMEVDFALTGAGGTVGFSPGAGDESVLLYLSQLQQAISDVQQSADAFCTASGEGDQACVDLRSVVSDANLLFSQLEGGYGGAFFPTAESGGATALMGRVNALRTRMLASGDSAFIASTWTASLPLATAGATGGINALFSDPAAGILADPVDGFQSIWEVGDVEAGAWVRVLDLGSGGSEDSARPLRVHLAAGATFRLGTGVSDRPDNFVDLGSGDGQNDLEIHGFGYLGVGSRLSARGTLRYGIQMEGDVARRISAPEQPIAPSASQGVYHWDPGDYLDVSVAPEFRLTPELSIGARLRYYRKGEDLYSSSAAPTGFDPALLQLETKESAQYVGAGVTLWPSDRTRLLGQWPLAASVSYITAISGSGGRTPKDDRLQIDMRVYFGIW